MAVFDDGYKERTFWLWYNSGKISATKLQRELVVKEEDFPSIGALKSWLTDWRERAEELDQQAKDAFTAEVIGNKVAMLRRHAEVGKELQDIGLEWIKNHKDELTSATVARIIRDGYEMERASVGVPEALEKMLSTSDEELIKQIEAIITDEDLDFLDAD